MAPKGKLIYDLPRSHYLIPSASSKPVTSVVEKTGGQAAVHVDTRKDRSQGVNLLSDMSWRSEGM